MPSASNCRPHLVFLVLRISDIILKRLFLVTTRILYFFKERIDWGFSVGVFCQASVSLPNLRSLSDTEGLFCCFVLIFATGFLCITGCPRT